MGYKEEIFERLEITGLSYSQILRRLREDKNGNTVRGETSGLRNLAVQYADVSNIFQRIKEAKKQKDIETIEREISGIDIDNAKDLASGQLNERIRIIEGEAEKDADIIKNSRSLSEIEKAIEDLKKLSPQKLGGIKSGQVRFRGSKKEQDQIGKALGFVIGE